MSASEGIEPHSPGVVSAPITLADDLDAAAVAAGERRRLTVMFCDLVGSTKLAAELDPEVYTELINAYYRVSGDIIRRYGGFVSQYLGDGILAFFGYPEAGETTAEDGVAAGLDMLRALGSMNSSDDNGEIAITARVGLHSGLVVVTEVGAPERRETHALGDAVNVAARVQALAEPNSVVVTDELKRRLEGAFTFESLGAKELKGVPDLVAVHRVVTHVPVSRREPDRPGGTFVGRTSELSLLADRWHSALEGDGQVVIVLGEPGIGKSALLQQLRADVEHTGAWVEVAASRLEHVQPFAVVKKLVESQFDWPAGTSIEERVADIEISLRQVADDPSEGAQLVSDLLGLPVGDRFTPLLVSPEEQRRRLMAWMIRWLTAQAAVRPVALVVEDLHWADPSSLETLAATLEQVASIPGLVIMTARLGFVPPWGTRSNHTLITLNRLGVEETRAIVRDRLGPGTPEITIDALADRSDGVPLFAEELARAVSEEVADAYGRDVPTSLYDSLMARLDRLGPVKAIAQIASAIGREFSFDMLKEVSGYTVTDLVPALARLDDAELVITRGLAPASSYQFRHVLVQQAAYDSMLRRRRIQLHRQIAVTLTRRSGEGESVAPELLAHHWTEAGEAREAIAAWQIAAQLSAARSAYAETSAHYERALALLDQLRDELDLVQKELVLQLGLTDALQMARGFGAPETIAAANRAKKLSEYLGDPQFRLRTLYNLWGTSMSSGEIMSSQVLADELVMLAHEIGDEQSACEAHIAQAGSLYNRGRLVEALDQAEAVFDRSPEALAEVVPASGVVQAALYGGAAAAALARIDRAHRFLAEIVSVERRTDSDPIAQILAKLSQSVVSVWLRDFDMVRTSSERLHEVGTQLGIDIIVGWAQIYGGWAEAMIGDASGVDRISAGLARHVAARQRLGLDHSLGLLAESQLMAGRVGDSFATVADALLLPDQGVQIQHTCELLRLRAELRAISGEDETAKADFRAALEMAKNMDAGLLELRAGAAFARFLGSHGDPDGARRMLAGIIDRHDVASFDGDNARAVLSELESMRKP